MVFRDKSSIVCEAGHCFDVSGTGYINFVPQQSKTAYTKDLFESRRQIFADGFYDRVLDAIAQYCDKYQKKPTTRVLDAGCGEGFFAADLANKYDIFAMDIQKEAVRLAAKANDSVKWMVGDVANIPLRSASVDVLLSIFSPANYGEFLRVLSPNGVVIKVVPGPGYLVELRELAGKKGYSNASVLEWFDKHVHCVDKTHLHYQLPMTEKQCVNFINMTPMMRHVDKNIDAAFITIDVEVVVGRRRCGVL